MNTEIIESSKSEIAYTGGKPVRKNKLFYGHHWIDEEDIKAVSDVLRDEFITCGPQVELLERKLSEYTGAKYTVVVSNGTAALHCACLAAGIEQGDEVITTPITFAASANCALYCGGTPVFADINPTTYNIDPGSIEEHITERTKAVVAVDFSGQAVEIERIRDICKKNNLIFIEDAAHSIGTEYNNHRVGSLADMTTFSFHPVKTITGGEGGAIQTNDRDFYHKLLLARSHGITHDDKYMEAAPPDGPWYYEQIALGFNYRLTDFQAALISSQMNKLDFFIKRRRDIVKEYSQAFSEIPEIILQEEINESSTCYHLFIIRLDLSKLNCTRRVFFDALSAENVQPQVHYVPVYWFPFYRKMGYERGLCPNAEKIYNSIMTLPLYPKMKDEDIEDVIVAVKKVCEYYRKSKSKDRRE